MMLHNNLPLSSAIACKQALGSSGVSYSCFPRSEVIQPSKALLCGGVGSRKTAIGKSAAAYEQSPPSAVFLSLKIASCEERTTAMGSCQFCCLATVIFIRRQKTVHREKTENKQLHHLLWWEQPYGGEFKGCCVLVLTLFLHPWCTPSVVLISAPYLSMAGSEWDGADFSFLSIEAKPKFQCGTPYPEPSFSHPVEIRCGKEVPKCVF